MSAAAARVSYLSCDCPLDLAPDEAHYWDWSRRLDWSYYSKGPLVAYLIRLGTTVAGAVSMRVCGDEMPAVRLPAVVCGSLLLVSLYVLTVQTYGCPRLAVAVVGVALTLPLVAAGSTLMTIDAPFTCCWGWALVLGHRAVFKPAPWIWPVLGLTVGLGIQAKYTMVLWLISFGLFLLATSQTRPRQNRAGFWAMLSIAALCCVPIVVWNARNDWVSVRHLLGHSKLDGAGVRVIWLGPGVYCATQVALLLGFWFVAWAAAMIAHRPGCEGDARKLYLWWMSAPAFVAFLLFSLCTPIQPNWPVTAYLSGLVLGAGWIDSCLRSPAPGVRRLVGLGVTAACAGGLGLVYLSHDSRHSWPFITGVVGTSDADDPAPLRRLDPTCRLRGWRFLASEVDGMRARLRASGVEPVLAATRWTMPGELGFYCAGRPVVYSLGLALGDRHSQYDLWHPNPIAEPERFCGRTFLVVGDAGPGLRKAFDDIVSEQVVVYRQNGFAVARWTITICRGYKGFPSESPREQGSRY